MAVTTFKFGVPTAPFLDQETGDISAPWRLFLLQLYDRTGGASGIDTAAGRAAALALTLTASPFAYTAPTPGTLFLAGGGVMRMTLQRGTRIATIGHFYEGVKMFTGDVLTITYSTRPLATFFPG